MNTQELTRRASEIRKLYDQHNLKERGVQWTPLQIAQGFVGDVGDLQKILMAKDGLRSMDDINTKLEHELADCLWSILVLSEKYNIDIEKAFLNTMEEVEKKITI